MCAISYPPELPISAQRRQIIDLVRRHPVVIVAGDTGSGKTTQLPKMMLEMGRAAGNRRIAITQPRRLAAVTMGERVADELGTPIGGLVGFRHRYQKKLTSETRIEFLTDGVLLNETKFDPLLRMYDTIIIDEAHERSLNVDFLLGILKRILQKRRDLKVIVASATMDTKRFAEFFSAPVIEVPGRLFPIEIRYRPAEDEESETPGRIAEALRELPREGDTLVFLSGERDIRETGEYLGELFGETDEIIPLLASLPAAEQKRAFTLSPKRRIILATNVAETSVTIPGIRHVIDVGEARISRYIHRTHIQRLQIEPISRASARQRAGRCGRLGPGICIRLYAEDDFLKRDEYTPPEILRSSLAGVILTMLDLKLGAIEEFPFIDPPKPTMIREGLKELLELGAIRSGYELTAIGHKLARIPLEPRLARILLAARDKAVLEYVLPIVAFMSSEDPRRRPLNELELARQKHAAWRVPGSDFLGTLKLWHWWQAQTSELSQSKARKLAKANYLAWTKLREWTELTRQLARLFGESAATSAKAIDEDVSARIHIALMTGLLGRIGHYHSEEREYRGTHALRFALHPGSVLAKRPAKRGGKREAPSAPPEWILAGELVDTGRLLAREAAAIQVEWIEPIAGDILKHHVHSPVWDGDSGFVRATEQVTLYGLTIVEARRCNYARFDPEGAREIFFRLGLLAGDISRPTPVLSETIAFLKELKARAEKTRDAEVFDELKLLAHFDAAVPKEVTDAQALKKWLARASQEEIAHFKLRRADWWPEESSSKRDFPDTIEAGGATFRLSYRNTPEEPEKDGITCTLRQNEIAALESWRSDWLVPGLLRKKVSYLLLSLPNSLQRLLKPLDDSLAILMDLLKGPTEPLTTAIRRAVRERWGFKIPADVWDKVKLPAYLEVRFVVKDKDGRIIYDRREKPLVEKPKPQAVPKRELTYEERKLMKETLDAERKFDLYLSTGIYPESTTDAVLEELAFLTFTDFALRVPIEILRRYPRYLKAIEVRLERAKISPSSDRAKEARFAPYWRKYREAAKNASRCDGAVLARYRWLLEELRIQIFAPELRTHEPVSPKRLEELSAALYRDD